MLMKKGLLFCFSLFLVLLASSSAFSFPTDTTAPMRMFQNSDGTVTLSWDANTETDLAGYKVYIGAASKTYSPGLVIGKVTTYITPKLKNGTWYFAVTAFNLTGQESGFSNEVSCVIAQPPAPPANLKIIKSTEVTVLNRRGVLIKWETTVPTTTKLTYGRKDSSSTITDPSLRTLHSVEITGLQPNQLYNYTVYAIASGVEETLVSNFSTK